MGRTHLAWTMVLAMMAAGCVEEDVRPPDTTPALDALDPTVLPYGLDDCDFVVAMVRVDAKGLAAYVPPGFELIPAGPMPGMPAQAGLGLEAFSCRSEGLGDAHAGYAYASVFAGVRPNQTLTRGEIDEYYVKWDTLVANATKRAALQDHGVAAHAGAARVAIEKAAVATIAAEVDMGAGGAFRVLGAGQAGPNVPGMEYIEYTPAQEGSLGAWHSTTFPQSFTARGRGAVTVDGDTWYGKLIGESPVAANIVGGRWSFAPGNITVPVTSGADVR